MIAEPVSRQHRIASIVLGGALVFGSWLFVPAPPAAAQGETRFMWVDEKTVAGRHVTLATGETLTFHKNRRFRRVTPFGETQTGRWEIYLNNTIYVTQDDGRNFFFHYEKINGDQYHFDAASRVKTKIVGIAPTN